MTRADYAWVETASIREAGCVTVVPAADRRGVLEAYGAVEASARSVGSIEALEMGDGSAGPICLVEVDGAIVVFEDNGFQGARPEVLAPASKASGSSIASSFFWNTNATTAFSAARRGKPVFSVELIGVEDDDLDGVPKPLRRHVLAADQDDDKDEAPEGGGMLAAGLDLVGRWTRVDFSRAATTGGTIFDTEPPPSELPTHTPQSSSVLGMDDAPEALTALTTGQQRGLAAWAAAAAAREGDVADEPAVARVLQQLANGTQPHPSPVVDALAAAAAGRSERFDRLGERLEFGEDLPPHPFHQLTVDDGWGDTKVVLSRLEWLYLNQRYWALTALRYAAHADAYSAALGVLDAASLAFHCGRTERGQTVMHDAPGRRGGGAEDNPRHAAFVDAATTLLAHLAARPDRAVAGATVALPVPLSADERSAAIQADLRAAADRAFH